MPKRIKTNPKESVWVKEKRYKCILCRQFACLTAMRKPSSNRNQLAVMISSHVLFGAVDLIHAKFSYETCVAVRKRICLAHFADAAKYIFGELTGIGTPFSKYEKGSVSLGTSVTVKQKNVPKLLLDCFNEVAKNFDKDLHVTAKDITKFMNQSLRRYYSVNGWDSISQSLPESRTIDAEEDATISSSMDNQEGSENIDNGIPLFELVEPSCSSSVKTEPISEDATTPPIRPLPRLEKTDPGLLEHSFIIDGEALLKLFRFCPGCGQELNAKGAVQLVIDGAAPMVQYVCKTCSKKKPVIKSWRAQEDHTWT